MWVADMDFCSSPAVIEALHQRVDHGIFGYSTSPAELDETIIRMLANNYAWNIKSDWIVWLPGLVTGLNISCRAVGEDGDYVLTNVPAYPPFLSAPGNSRRQLLRSPMIEQSEKWVIDFDQMKAAITPQTGMFILCNPHNPTGRVFTREELSEIASICMNHDIIICSDEIHCGLVLDQEKTHIPTATLSPEVADRTITLMAPSKTYNLPGLGCSFAVISNPELRKSFRRAMSGIVPHVNTLGYTAALAAYRDSHEWHHALINYLRCNRDTVEDSISAIPDLSLNHIEATYLAWIDTRASGIDNPTKFFEDYGVGLSDGSYFDGPDFVRLNFGCPRNTLEKALDRMHQAVTSGKGN